MVEYLDSVDEVSPQQLDGGFFEGWPNPPSPETHLAMLRSSSEVVLALEPGSGKIVGFIHAISDGVLNAHIPLLEVLPDHRGRGVGAELVRRILQRLSGLYAIDLVCDESLRPFYESLGMKPVPGMAVRHYPNQNGRGY